MKLPAGIPYKETSAGISIEVRVVPRSSKKGIEGIMGSSVVKVKLTAPPVDNAANEQLIEVLSDAFGVRKSQIRIIQGQTSKTKVVEIAGTGKL